MTANYWYNFRYSVNCTFFDVLHAPTITTKLLKLRDPFGSLAPMPKLASKKKYALCIIYSVCCLYVGYGPIYRQIGGVKFELGFLFTLKLRVLGV
jgi:hypothetical protein